MAGGTHADHEDVEAILAGSFSATGKPFSDAEIDAMCVAAEALIDVYLGQYGYSLPTSENTGWKYIVVLTVRNMMDLSDKWDKAGGSMSTASEMGTAQYAQYGASVLTREIRQLIEMKVANTEGGVTYGDSVSSS